MDLDEDEEDLLVDGWLLSDSDSDAEFVQVEYPTDIFNDSEGQHPRRSVLASNDSMTEDSMHIRRDPVPLNVLFASRQVPAVTEIEGIFTQLEDSLNQGTELCLLVPARSRSRRGAAVVDRVTDSRRHIRFPSRTAREAWRFTALLKVLQIVYESLVNGTIISKRDIFYRDPALFVRQSVVDRMVDDVAAAFNVPRSSLNVIAAAKGLVSGRIKITKADGAVLNPSQDHEGQLISLLKEDDNVDSLAARWILVIEKEAVFRAILSSDSGTRLIQQGILITGKGYPDIATRRLLRRLALPLPNDRGRVPPIVGLVDYDPDGIAILSTYKHGSESLRHENHLLCVPNIRWLGLRSRDIFCASTTSYRQGTLLLSARDRRRAVKMLQKEQLQEGMPDAEQWRRELQIMLMLNIKAEIELLDDLPGGVGRWILEKLPCIQ